MGFIPDSHAYFEFGRRFIFVTMIRLNLKLSLSTQISPTPFAGDVLRRSLSNPKDI